MELGVRAPVFQFEWKRYWSHRGDPIALLDGGFLSDPENEFGKIVNSKIVEIYTLSNVPCVVLLGEPGMGKTTELFNFSRYLKQSPNGDEVLSIDLADFNSDTKLCKELFEHEKFQSWKNGKYCLTIYLDGFDEGILTIKTLAKLLANEFVKIGNEPVRSRLKVRITCRSAVWPELFEQTLVSLWGNESFGIFELLPLTRKNVINAAKSFGIDSGTFIAELDRLQIVPFAIKPVTLKFLLQEFKMHGKLPAIQTEIYESGCRYLCEEINPGRLSAGRRGVLNVSQRLRLAGHIAAVMVLSNKLSIWLGVSTGAKQEDVSLDVLTQGLRIFEGVGIRIGDDVIREVLDTGLFSLRDENRIGWAHQTYAEFLAAWYLTEIKMPLVQIISIFSHPVSQTGKLVPQLHETAAWLAALRSDVYAVCLKVDPQVLLRSALNLTKENQRVELVGALLEFVEKEKIVDPFSKSHLYRNLFHPALSDQLRPYIVENSKSLYVRRVAIDIAERCELKELQGILADITLDTSIPFTLRTEAAYAVTKIGDSATKSRLKPLAYGTLGEDPDDELKGCALTSLWPDHINVDEVFSLLTDSKSWMFIGSYRSFISHHFPDHLSMNDLPIALKWVEGRNRVVDLSLDIEYLIEGIIVCAWEHLTSPNVLEEFSRVALARLIHDNVIIRETHRHPSFHDLLSENDEKRRMLLVAMLPRLNDVERYDLILCNSHTPIVLPKDVLWLISQCNVESSEGIQRILANLVKRVCDWSNPDHMDAIIIAAGSVAVLKEVFKPFLDPIELNTPETEKLKLEYSEAKERQNPKRIEKVITPSPQDQVSMFLSECETISAESFWKLNMAMMMNPDGSRGSEYASDLTAMPVWKLLDDSTHLRILEVAKKYLYEIEPLVKSWLGTDSGTRLAMAGYRVFRLLHSNDTSFIDGLPMDIWKKWSPVLLWWHAYESEENAFAKTIVEYGYRFAPEEIIETMVILLRKEDRDHKEIFIVRKLEGCCDQRLADKLLEEIKGGKLQLSSACTLMEFLISHNDLNTRIYAESILRENASKAENQELAIAIGAVLTATMGGSGWIFVWPFVKANQEFGKKVITKIGDRFDSRIEVLDTFSEDQLGELYLLMVQWFPYDQDPIHKGAHWVGSEDRVRQWRDSMVRRLKERGTTTACQVIRRLIGKLPGFSGLKVELIEAEAITLFRSWNPPTPLNVIELIDNGRRRFVQGGNQLLDVLMESLGRFQLKLQGETPTVVNLWNDDPYRPKSENVLSDRIKNHFDDDLREMGIVVNREVEIKRLKPTGIGDRTDIHVDAVEKGAEGANDDILTVVIEVKGCWHRALFTAMETQLKNGYLHDIQCSHGLYVVGWFKCDVWDSTDSRCAQVPSISLDEMKNRLEAQAVKVSNDSVRIISKVIDARILP